MKGRMGKLLAILAALGCTSPAWSGTYDATVSRGTAWLSQQRNPDDGSWGTSEAVKYVQTAEVVLALSALNQQGAAYYGGVAWLGNHAPANIDFAARRVLALGAANQSIAADLQTLQAAQRLAAPGNSGWGLSQTYQGSPLDTALTLQALNQQGITTNVSAAVTYLTSAQLTGLDAGWTVGGETTSDPVTTAQVLIALIPLKAQYPSLATPISNGLAALNAKVTSASPPPQIALAALANLRNNTNSTQGIALLSTLVAQQGANGDWGGDPYVTALALRAAAAGAGKDLSAQKQTVAVPDNALRAAINAALGHGALDAITLGQIQSLTSLNASGLGIADLTGLQYATNLTYLDVSNNNIKSFAPVAGLTSTIIAENGNPGYPGTSTADVPTLPEWGVILLGSLLLMQTMRLRQRTSGKGTHQ